MSRVAIRGRKKEDHEVMVAWLLSGDLKGSPVRTRGTGAKELRERRNGGGLDRTTFSD